MFRSSKIALFVTFWLILQTHPILGCVNLPESPLKVGQPIYTETLGPQEYIQKLLSGHLAPQDWEASLADATRSKSEKAIAFDENSIAAALIHLGRIEEALRILESLEKRRPASYYTAANLGTAYELMGNNEQAYKWIAIGMKRNPASHFGTEWLHLKILRAKQEMKKDPKWMDENSVLGINWDAISNDLSKVQVSDDRGTVYTAETVRKAIEYQLHERTEFVKPPDQTVASLLFDLSHLVRNSRSEEHGDLVLNAAYTYGHPRAAVDSPSPEIDNAATVATVLDSGASYWPRVGILIPVLVALGLAGLWLRSRHAKLAR